MGTRSWAPRQLFFAAQYPPSTPCLLHARLAEQRNSATASRVPNPGNPLGSSWQAGVQRCGCAHRRYFAAHSYSTVSLFHIVLCLLSCLHDNLNRSPLNENSEPPWFWVPSRCRHQAVLIAPTRTQADDPTALVLTTGSQITRNRASKESCSLQQHRNA